MLCYNLAVAVRNGLHVFHCFVKLLHKFKCNIERERQLLDLFVQLAQVLAAVALSSVFCMSSGSLESDIFLTSLVASSLFNVFWRYVAEQPHNSQPSQASRRRQQRNERTWYCNGDLEQEYGHVLQEQNKTQCTLNTLKQNEWRCHLEPILLLSQDG